MITVELIPDPEEGGFTARLPDIPAYGEGETEDEAIADLKEALQGYIEAFGLEDAVARLSESPPRVGGALEAEYVLAPARCRDRSAAPERPFSRGRNRARPLAHRGFSAGRGPVPPLPDRLS